jgi:hypothetical protein
MAEFTKLNARERAVFRRLETFTAQRTRFVLLRHAARATIRLVDAMTAGLTPTKPEDAAILAALARRKADAYERLRHLDGAVRFADGVARLALRHLRLRDGP